VAKALKPPEVIIVQRAAGSLRIGAAGGNAFLPFDLFDILLIIFQAFFSPESSFSCHFQAIKEALFALLSRYAINVFRDALLRSGILQTVDSVCLRRFQKEYKGGSSVDEMILQKMQKSQ